MTATGHQQRLSHSFFLLGRATESLVWICFQHVSDLKANNLEEDFDVGQAECFEDSAP